VLYVWNGAILLKRPERTEPGDPDAGGFACRGCVVLRDRIHGFFRAEDVSEEEMLACEALGKIRDLGMHALSRGEFLRHLMECPGQRRLAPELVDGLIDT